MLRDEHVYHWAEYIKNLQYTRKAAVEEAVGWARM